MSKAGRKLWRRFILLAIAFGLVIFSALFFWARVNYPSYAKDFYISHKWGERDQAVLLKTQIADYSQYELNPAFEHRYVQLNQSEDWQIPTALIEDLPTQASLIIDLECWGSKYWPVYRSAPLGAVSEGVYDQKIIQLADMLASLKQEVYLNFNPQMEVPGRFFPWQEYPSVYIDAYRHVQALIKSKAPSVKMLWSPAGYPGLEEYYPGSDYVDALSITLIAHSEIPLEVYPKMKLEDEVYRRLHRLRFFNHECLVLAGQYDDLSPELWQSQIAFQKANPQLYNRQYFEHLETKVAEDSLFHLGVYDPDRKLDDLAGINAEHLFINLATYKKEGFFEELEKVKQNGRELILTLETIEDRNFERDDQCLEKLLNGEYDPELEELLDSLQHFPRQIYLRFSQEMEIPIERYPWQSKDPKLYIDAYRYLMLRAEKAIPNILKVWGPAGDRGSLEWYPGSDQVDYISIAIYGLPDKNITDPTQQEQFAQIYRRKSWRMRQAPEPIFITEFGVKGPEDFQEQWLLKAAETIKSAEEIAGINYFNMHDVPKAWGDIAPPDWSVEAQTYRNFIKALDRP
ncbi:glycoside hydrolase family 26 protein [Croceimicrobium hydrocarbonivorans]|uniref:GH26 domain-containing protein n=1 Tax=Croceimicrobium hydrocarbonivorans TaxID=2761580 RepID=A0A7H0VIU6_9FLAO|nr:hypothetical protein [Croceimicrobium hydrocarbonivorans]QNR25644.1 hypothetical protein H4K34_07325 [Croceimicrobium hydrocarbonivorans]